MFGSDPKDEQYDEEGAGAEMQMAAEAAEAGEALEIIGLL
jgi:hypothetical protein